MSYLIYSIKGRGTRLKEYRRLKTNIWFKAENFKTLLLML